MAEHFIVTRATFLLRQYSTARTWQVDQSLQTEEEELLKLGYDKIFDIFMNF